MSQKSSAERERLMKAIKRELAQHVWRERREPVDETTFRSLFDQNPEPMWVYDVRTLEVLEVNQAAQERYGYTRDEFLHLTLVDLRPEEDVPKFRELTRSLPTSDRTGPWRHRLKDGSVIQVLITSHAVKLRERDARLVMAENISEDPDMDLDSAE